MSAKNHGLCNKGKRRAVMAKCNGACWYCGGVADTVDHVEPWTLPPNYRRTIKKNHINNLLPACAPCNLRKRNMLLDEYRNLHRRAKKDRNFRFWGEQFLPFRTEAHG